MSEYRTGKCRWCGCDGDVFRDNGLCVDCDSDTIRCQVCRCRQHVTSRCRHVFQDRWGQWAGAGTGREPTTAVRRAFFELLTLMPEGFAADLRTAIESGRFYTWMIAPLIGAGGLLEMNGMVDLKTARAWGRAMITLGEREDAEEIEDGYHWLASLYKNSTREANKTTVRWIDKWMSAQVPKIGVWHWNEAAVPRQGD